MKKWYVTVSRELASLNLTFILLVLLILLSAAGAWIPQIGAISDRELLQRFGTDGSKLLIDSGLHDVFHSPTFLAVVALLFVNLAFCTKETMMPRIKAKVKPVQIASTEEINNLPVKTEFVLKEETTIDQIKDAFSGRGFRVRLSGDHLIAEKGRFGWLAAPVTHAGLFILMAGVVFSSLTGYSGRVYLEPEQSIPLREAQKTKPVWGAIPDWSLRLSSTRRENYANGKPKQWFSDVEFVQDGAVKQKSTVSVNNPCSFQGIEFFQSDWRIEKINMILAGEKVELPVQEMAGDFMGVFPLLPDLLLIASVSEADGRAKLYLKPESASKPKLIARLEPGQEFKLGKLGITYSGTTVKTGLQYKHDPGQYVVYASFAFLFVGAIFVATPSMRILGAFLVDENRLIMGAASTKFMGLARKEVLNLRRKLAADSGSEVVSLES